MSKPSTPLMTTRSKEVTFLQMKEAIGTLLFLWSDIEKALGAAIRKLNRGKLPKSAHGISASLRAWAELVAVAADGRARHLQDTQRLTLHLKQALVVRN